MSGIARKVALVAGVVAIAAVTAGAGLGLAGFAPGLGIAGVGSFTAIASTAATISGIASFAANGLAKPPPARGSVTSTSIGTDLPPPYLIGETYYGGSRQHQTGYGPTIDKVPNPYALIVDVYSGAGPVEGLVDCQADFVSLGVPPGGGAASGYAGGFLWAAVQRGAVPENAALTPHWAGAPGWGADYRLSGYAAIAWSLLFDRKGKVFASGVPQLGAVWRGQRAWDPRQDSSLPGGQGPHRWASPSDTAAHDAARATWTYNECPGLQALRYALGAWHRDPRVAGSTYQKVAGIGLPIAGIIVEDFVHLANVCDANGWKTGGMLFEPTIGAASSRWQNLKDILAAGGAEPCFRSGRLGLKLSAPRIALDTITREDVADDEIVVCSGAGWEDRLNTLIPKYRSRDHKWEYVASTTKVSVASQVAIDGEVKQTERQFNLVQQGQQAAQLCAYELIDRRELGEIEIVVKPRLRKYGPGDLLIVDLPDDGLAEQPCVILKRLPMPDRMAWKFTLRSETPGKHAFALGQTAVAPPVPMLRSTADLDGVAAPVESASGLQLAIATSFPIGLSITAAADGSITISDHTRRYTDGHPDVAVAGTAIASGLAAGDFRAIGYDDPDRLGGAVTYLLDADDINARASPDHPGRHYLGYAIIPTAGSPPSNGGGATPPGGNCPTVDTPILMADMTEKPAGEITVGDRVWTRHEATLAWGFFPVETVELVDSEDVWSATIGGKALRATGDHRVYVGEWVAMRDVPGALLAAGVHQVVKMTVTTAHTYVSNGILSHNIKATQPDA
ncbi:Hint domain-containing protein [Sphingomonas melonis]|uniref:Hint domain-containing protein n=1 Tax=Sphingomonas melonis TaxID=152682 RepID=UPI000373F92D|nr:Hint domain-containing protein [Sphingomonas melonis]